MSFISFLLTRFSDFSKRVPILYFPPPPYVHLWSKPWMKSLVFPWFQSSMYNWTQSLGKFVKGSLRLLAAPRFRTLPWPQLQRDRIGFSQLLDDDLRPCRIKYLRTSSFRETASHLDGHHPRRLCAFFEQKFFDEIDLKIVKSFIFNIFFGYRYFFFLCNRIQHWQGLNPRSLGCKSFAITSRPCLYANY